MYSVLPAVTLNTVPAWAMKGLVSPSGSPSGSPPSSAILTPTDQDLDWASRPCRCWAYTAAHTGLATGAAHRAPGSADRTVTFGHLHCLI